MVSGARVSGYSLGRIAFMGAYVDYTSRSSGVVRVTLLTWGPVAMKRNIVERHSEIVSDVLVAGNHIRHCSTECGLSRHNTLGLAPGPIWSHAMIRLVLISTRWLLTLAIYQII